MGWAAAAGGRGGGGGGSGGRAARAEAAAAVLVGAPRLAHDLHLTRPPLVVQSHGADTLDDAIRPLRLRRERTAPLLVLRRTEGIRGASVSHRWLQDGSSRQLQKKELDTVQTNTVEHK